jgi:hypothetical protein
VGPAKDGLLVLVVGTWASLLAEAVDMVTQGVRSWTPNT